MFLYKVFFNLSPLKPFNANLLVILCSALLFHLTIVTTAKEVKLSTSGSDLSTTVPDNPTDSTAEESSVKQYRKVRDNIPRYGAIYRGNSSIRSTRAFTRRPKASRKDKHRHSTKVDTTKLPIVLLPPILTFRNSEKRKIEKDDPFVINVVSPEPLPTTIPDLITNSFSTEFVTTRNPNDEGTNRPFVDDKIMAMRNFGVRMQAKARGEVKFQSSTHSSELKDSSTPTLNYYTPPPTYFPSAQKYRQVGRLTYRRRNRVRATTVQPVVGTEVSTEQTLPRENQYDNYFTSISQDSPTTPSNHNGFDTKYTESSDDSSISTRHSQETTTFPSYSDFTNSSLADVVNYDIQRTSPRTFYSLDVTGPISSVGSTQSSSQFPSNTGDTRSEANTEQVNYEGSDFLSDNPASSPGSPTTHVDDFFSNVPDVSSSLVPRMEINVVTSTSQFLDRTTPSTDDGRLELKDLIYPPLNILAPPFLEDEFHDVLGNVILNATVLSNDTSSPDEFATTQNPDLSKSTVGDLVEINVSPVVGEWNTSSLPAQDSYQDFDDNSLGTHAQQNVGLNEQYSDCENGDCQGNLTVAKPWTRIPVAPSDIKVLSNTEGIALINRMYENLLRVLNGGPDYYDLSDEPQQELVENKLEPEPRRETTTESSALLAEESGDIRNIRQRGRSRNNLVPSGERTPRKKIAHHKEENQELKKAKSERKASHLCNSKTLSYVADVSSGCKIFYVCTEYGVGEPMFCPNGTLFNQDYLVCDWWYNVECS